MFLSVGRHNRIVSQRTMMAAIQIALILAVVPLSARGNAVSRPLPAHLPVAAVHPTNGYVLSTPNDYELAQAGDSETQMKLFGRAIDITGAQVLTIDQARAISDLVPFDASAGYAYREVVKVGQTIGLVDMYVNSVIGGVVANFYAWPAATPPTSAPQPFIVASTRVSDGLATATAVDPATGASRTEARPAATNCDAGCALVDLTLGVAGGVACLLTFPESVGCVVLAAAGAATGNYFCLHACVVSADPGWPDEMITATATCGPNQNWGPPKSCRVSGNYSGPGSGYYLQGISVFVQWLKSGQSWEYSACDEPTGVALCSYWSTSPFDVVEFQEQYGTAVVSQQPDCDTSWIADVNVSARFVRRDDGATVYALSPDTYSQVACP